MPIKTFLAYFLFIFLFSLSGCQGSNSFSSKDSLSGKTSGPGDSTTMLENTYWKLIWLGNESLTLSANGKEPFITLMPQVNRVQGFSGCNQMTGSYELKGENLKFGQMASTRMACQNGMELEASFFKALESAIKWNIKDNHLELSDLKGALVARFESRDLK
jgi:copper homeostasis protein (lipoprotein)